jgi:hypothetical protein
VLITIGWSKHKKLITSDAKFKTLRFFYGLGLLILSRIPEIMVVKPKKIPVCRTLSKEQFCKLDCNENNMKKYITLFSYY